VRSDSYFESTVRRVTLGMNSVMVPAIWFASNSRVDFLGQTFFDRTLSRATGPSPRPSQLRVVRPSGEHQRPPARSPTTILFAEQEVCELHVEDFDLHLDDEHVRLHGKGSSARTVLLDDRDLVQWPEPGGQRPGIREA
jgi:hypothetical protein